MNNLLANACPPPARSIPVLEISGLADPVMPWNGASYATHPIFSADSSASFWAARNGCLGAPTDSLVEGVSIAGPVGYERGSRAMLEVQRWGIPGLPHTWPLGSTYGSLGIARFLLRFRRD
jgi:poly(3-hydroxybutyrate) depolymerase